MSRLHDVYKSPQLISVTLPEQIPDELIPDAFDAFVSWERNRRNVRRRRHACEWLDVLEDRVLDLLPNQRERRGSAVGYYYWVVIGNEYLSRVNG